MKVKGVSAIFFAVSVVGTIFCRIYQILKPDENASLFFSSEFFCFSISAVCYIILAIFTKIIGRKSEIVTPSFRITKNLPAAFFGVLLGVLVLVNGILILVKYVNGYRSASPLFEGVFGTLAGPIFILTGVCYGVGKNLFVDNELLSLIPVAWGASRTINIFLGYNMTSNVAWELTDVLAAIFISLFLLNHAKCIAVQDDPKKLDHLRLYGYASIMFVLIYTTRSFIVKNSGTLALNSTNSGLFNMFSNFWVVDIFIAFYILFVILSKDYVSASVPE